MAYLATWPLRFIKSLLLKTKKMATTTSKGIYTIGAPIVIIS